MGSKTRRNSKSSKKCESRFPVGEFRKQRAALPFEIEGNLWVKETSLATK